MCNCTCACLEDGSADEGEVGVDERERHGLVVPEDAHPVGGESYLAIRQLHQVPLWPQVARHVGSLVHGKVLLRLAHHPVHLQRLGVVCWGHR